MTKKIFAAFTGAALALSVVAAPSSASAQTIEELQAQIQALLAQVAALQGSATVNASFTRDLTVGSTGADVMQLQKFLNANGFILASAGAGSPGLESSYFGPLTASALASYQAAKGISPAVGYFGPITRTSVNAAISGGATTGGSTGSAGLSGGAGDITLSSTSKYSNEEVGEGEDDVPVLAFDVEADDNSDIRIDSIKVEFVQSTGADSDDLDDYADEISVWFDGEKVGSADADEFSQSSDDYWSKTINLDNSVVIEAGDEERITIAVTALNNLDSGDIDTDAWEVDILSIRFTDGDGVTISESVDAANTANGTYSADFDFASFGTANDAELDVSLGDEDINDAQILDVDDDSDTEHDVLSFILEADGDSDIWVDEIPVVITTTGEGDEAVLLIAATLYADGEEVGSEDVPTGGAVTFDDLDMWIDAGDEVEFILEVEIQDTDGAADNGDTVQATVTVASIDAEDEAGDSVTATGAAVGDAHTIYDAGIMADFVSSSESVTFTADESGENDRGTFTIKFDVTAFDGDMYIDRTCAEDEDQGDAGEGLSYTVTNSGSNSTSCNLTAAGSESGDTANVYEVEEGDTRTFTLTVVVTASADHFAEVAIEAINWDNESADTTPDFFYTANLDDFETDSLFLNSF